ncbi:MAG TPA: hypothetical protein ACFYD9_10530 [Candidatus Wunengus sp. YC64]|uniref:hypothetical protein n=1 Tax=Candidatus Wunengus sp. YC64 TaxID=3367700 RepID=UPI004026218A
MLENIPIIKSIIELFVSIWSAIGKIFGSRGKSSVQTEIPKKIIVIPPSPNHRDTWWHMGSSAGKPAMQVVGRFKVTNITKYSIFLCAAKMRKPKLFGYVSVKDSKSQYHGFYEIPPTGISDLSFDFWIIPPLKKERETFTTDVAIIDQFGNEHWIKGIDFIYK